MSTTMRSANPLAGDTPADLGPGAPGIPFTRLVHLETRKVVDTRSGRWLLASIALTTVAVLGLALWLAPDGADLSLLWLLGLAAKPPLTLYPVLGILTAASEFSQRTGVVTFTVEPRRHRVVLAKTVAAGAWALVGIALAGVFAAAAHAGAVTFREVPADWSLDGGVLGGFVLVQLLAVVQGIAFGLLLTRPAAAIATYFVVPPAWTLSTSYVPGMDQWAVWLDPARASVPLGAGAMHGADWAHLATASGLWVVLPILVGTVLLHRREIK